MSGPWLQDDPKDVELRDPRVAEALGLEAADWETAVRSRFAEAEARRRREEGDR